MIVILASLCSASLFLRRNPKGDATAEAQANTRFEIEVVIKSQNPFTLTILTENKESQGLRGVGRQGGSRGIASRYHAKTAKT